MNTTLKIFLSTAIALSIIAILIAVRPVSTPNLGALQTTGENSFYGLTTSSSADALATSTLLLAANNTRQYVRLTNMSGNVVYLGLGTTAVASKGISIAASSTYEINPLNLFKGAIYGVASATSTLLVVEK